MKTSIRFRLVECLAPARETGVASASHREGCTVEPISPGRSFRGEFDNFILVLLADQEWREARASRAEYLIEALYDAFDRKPVPKHPADSSSGTNTPRW